MARLMPIEEEECTESPALTTQEDTRTRNEPADQSPEPAVEKPAAVRAQGEPMEISGESLLHSGPATIVPTTTFVGETHGYVDTTQLVDKTPVMYHSDPMELSGPSLEVRAERPQHDRLLPYVPLRDLLFQPLPPLSKSQFVQDKKGPSRLPLAWQALPYDPPMPPRRRYGNTGSVLEPNPPNRAMPTTNAPDSRPTDRDVVPRVSGKEDQESPLRAKGRSRLSRPAGRATLQLHSRREAVG